MGAAVEGTITVADLDRQIERLRAKERDLKRKSRIISSEIQALRPQFVCPR
jgi:chaperonin cofactor prefoldin